MYIKKQVSNKHSLPMCLEKIFSPAEAELEGRQTCAMERQRRKFSCTFSVSCFFTLLHMCFLNSPPLVLDQLMYFIHEKIQSCYNAWMINLLWSLVTQLWSRDDLQSWLNLCTSSILKSNRALIYVLLIYYSGHFLVVDKIDRD